MSYTSVHLPVGYSVDIKGAADPDWISLGVTAQAGTLEFTYDAIKVTGTQAEKVLNFIKNMAMKATFSLYQLELSNINRIMAGATAYAAVAGATTARKDEYDNTTGADEWACNVHYPFLFQSDSGDVPTSISVVQDPAGTPATLVLNTDYVVTKEAGGWGIRLLDTTDTDPTKDIEFNYSTTAIASRTLSAGASSVDIDTKALRVRKLLDTGKYWSCEIYAAANTNGLSFNLPRFDEDEPTVLEVQMEGQLDTTRTSMDQLFKITDQFGVTNI